LLSSLIGSLWVSRLREPFRAYASGLTFARATLICTGLAWLGFHLGIPLDPSASLRPQRLLFGPAVFALDELHAPPAPGVALVHSLTALAAARVQMRRFSFAWSLAAEVLRLACFSCKGSWLLIGLMTMTMVPGYFELATRRRPTRVFVIHMATALGLMAI